MLNSGKTDTGTKINVFGTSNYIYIYPESIHVGIISVKDKAGNVLWQKCGTSDDIPFALEIAKRGIKTGIFETD